MPPGPPHVRVANARNGTRPATTFEVPEAAAAELTLVYSPNFLETTYEIQLY